MAKVPRLLERIIPQRYRLDIDVDMDQFAFTAREDIIFELSVASRELVFHAVGLDVTADTLDGKTKPIGISLNKDDQTVTFNFENEVPVGKHSLSVHFKGSINESLHGFYRSNYAKDRVEKWLASTQFEAVSAREAFICIDEPSAKAVFEIALIIPDSLTAISNTNVVSESPAGAGLKKVQFEATPKMSTYLVAYIVGEFEFVEQTTTGNVVIRAYATPGQSGQLSFALDAAVRILTFYNEYFGVPYPLPKLDMVAIPDFASGAMENWGLVTYRETALLLDLEKTSLGHKQRVAEVVAHELAHMWFGDLVTMQWWDDLWLNEGFATWVASLAMAKLWPEWEIWTQFIQEEFAQALEMDSLANTHPIQVEVEDPRELDEIFDAISYAKGASVINMLHNYLGSDDFKRGLQRYLKNHAYGNTVTRDLWAALEAASSKPVIDVMNTWITKPGYPLVSFEKGQVAQQRFYSSPREAAKANQRSDRSLWHIPFSVLVARGKETEKALIKSASELLGREIMLADWFKPNPGQTSIYRTLYTEAMIEALASPMQSGDLSATDRFGVVSDVFATTEAGVTNSATALTLVETMRKETNYVVWGGIGSGFGSIDSILEDESLRARLDQFGRWLVAPNVKRLGWKSFKNEVAFDTLMRPMVLQQAVRFDDEAATKRATRLFADYLDGQPLDSDLRPVVLYAAARHGGRVEFDSILERYRTESSPQVKTTLLASLGRFRDPALIKRFLELGLSPDVRPQDTYIVLAWGFRNREARVQTWEWVKSNWDVFIQRYGAGGHMLERFPLYAATGFATHQMAAEIQEFFGSHPHPATKRPTAQAVESVKLKADWFQRDRDNIEAFLNDWEAKQ